MAGSKVAQGARIKKIKSLNGNFKYLPKKQK